MEHAIALTFFGLIIALGAIVQNSILSRHTDRTIKEIGERTNQMIQAEDARAKELLAKIESSIVETRNVVVETRNMVAKMDERAQEADKERREADKERRKADEERRKWQEESDKERRAHEKFMEEILARIHEKVH